MKRLIISLTCAAGGIAAMMAGIGVDAWLHAQDETLAAREGIFTLSNPGHALLATGTAIASGGVLSALHAAWVMSGPRGLLGRSIVRNGTLGAAAAASVAAAVFALAVSSSGHEHSALAAGAPHTHDAVMTDAEAAAVSGSPTVALVDADAMDLHAEGTAHAHMEPAEASGPSDAADEHHRVKPTAEERACMAALRADVKAATLRFEDYDVAIAEGYRSNPAKPEATHYANRAYMADGTVMDYAYPESLVYVTGADGGKKLAGALFKAMKGQGPQPCGNATSWHTHGGCIDPATGMRVDEGAGHTCPAGYEFRDGRVEMMHVWFLPRERRR